MSKRTLSPGGRAVLSAVAVLSTVTVTACSSPVQIAPGPSAGPSTDDTSHAAGGGISRRAALTIHAADSVAADAAADAAAGTLSIVDALRAAARQHGGTLTVAGTPDSAQAGAAVFSHVTGCRAVLQFDTFTATVTALDCDGTAVTVDDARRDAGRHDGRDLQLDASELATYQASAMARTIGELLSTGRSPQEAAAAAGAELDTGGNVGPVNGTSAVFVATNGCTTVLTIDGTQVSVGAARCVA